MDSSAKQSNWRGRLIRYAPILFWIGVIFYLSSGAGAITETSRFIRPLLEFFFPAADAATLQLYHGYIRKSAHVAVYFVLGLLAARAFASSQIERLRLWWPAAVLALVIAIAAGDEFQQSFNEERTGAAGDVLLDTVGGLLSVLVFVVVRSVWTRSRRPSRLRR